MRSMLHKISELCGFLVKNYTSMIMTATLYYKSSRL
jgi:hypothetical protein